ncbi:MAG: hypothetical protein WC763_06095 [Candidatus Paceibacterota bacterium]|jgi:hypothetical protein
MLPLRGQIGNVIIPVDPWPDYIMDLVADCVNVIGTIDEAWHWAELEEAMVVETNFRKAIDPC